MIENFGYHISKKEIANVKNISAVQVFPGSPQSFSFDENFSRADNLKGVVHGAYVFFAVKACVEGSVDYKYMVKLDDWTSKNKFDYSLLHLGATKGVEVDQIALRLIELGELVSKSCLKKPLLIENVAAAYPVNNSEIILHVIKEHRPWLGMCFDTCHSYSSGWSDEEIVSRIDVFEPEVIHFNAAAVYDNEIIKRGGGRDRHGYFMQKKQDDLLNSVLKLLHSKKDRYKPLVIMEGASYPGSIFEEMDYVNKVWDALNV